MNEGRRSAVLGAILLACVVFAISNIAWRYGEGSVVLIAAERSLLAAVIVLPWLLKGTGPAEVRAILKDRWSIMAVITSGATVPIAATMFRTLTGPQAALALAIGPALILIPAHFVVHRPLNKALPFVLLSVVFAIGAAASGGLGTAKWAAVLGGALFLIIDMASVLTGEKARSNHSAMIMVSLSMIVAAALSVVVVVGTGAVDDLSLSGFWIALVVAVGGTLGRVLRLNALPHVGSVVSSSAGQITAVLTALGGIVLFRDELSAVALTLSVLAALSCVVAVSSVTRQPKPQADLAQPVP